MFRLLNPESLLYAVLSRRSTRARHSLRDLLGCRRPKPSFLVPCVLDYFCQLREIARRRMPAHRPGRLRWILAHVVNRFQSP